MSYVLYERQGRIGHIILNRPERRNAMGTELMQAWIDAFNRFYDDKETAVAIFSARGPAYSAGADIKEFTERGPATLELLNRLYPCDSDDLRKPVIAAIHGKCMGFHITCMLTDLRIAAESAVFGLPEIARGIQLIATPLLHQLPRNIVLELALLGENIDAQRAYELGIVNKVVPEDQLMPTATRWAERIASMPPLAMKLTRQVWLRATWPDKTCLQLENVLWRSSLVSEDVMEGMKAWKEKREPVWKRE